MADDTAVLHAHKHLSKEGTLKALCETCRELLIRPDLDVHTDTQTTYHTEKIREAARRGCRICTYICNAWRERNGSPDESSFGAILYIERRMIEFGVRPHALYLAPYTDLDGEIMIQRERYHPFGPDNISLASPIVSTGGSDLRYSTMKAWLDDCTQNHSSCQRMTSGTQGLSLPTRLIQVLPSEDPALVLTNQLVCEPSIRYATLSHRWCNVANMPLLLKQNLLELQKGIPIASLPKTFRDAMELCRRLGICHLWIDSLCLIQDDAADCEKEIANMGNIYKSAFLNLAATGAAEFSDRGLHYESDCDNILPFHVPLHRQGLTMNYLAYPYKTTCVPTSRTLMLRGWVLQERMLSSRSIFFDDFLGWECHAMLVNEVFPRASSPFQPFICLGQSQKLSRFLDLQGCKPGVGDRKIELYSRWRQVCVEFSRCELTYCTDALAAISGLAREFGQVLDDAYLAGLWQNDLILGLLWYVRRGLRPREHNHDKPLPTVYIAPSWSWLSVASEVHFIANGYMSGNTGQDCTVTAENIKHSIKLASSDPMGPVFAGQIKLLCHIRPAHDRKTAHGQIPAMEYEQFDDGYDGNWTRDVRGSWYCVLLVSASYPYVLSEYGPKKTHLMEGGWIGGLILEIAQEFPRIFRRIGCFTHPWTEEGAEPMAEYPEFADVVDSRSLEREEITII